MDATMRRRLGFTCRLLLVVGSLISWTLPAFAGDAARSGAMRMYRDPETGLVGRPPAAALQAEVAEPAAAARAPEREEPVQAPAGGVKINLGGGHRSAVVRMADPGAPPVHECVDATGSPRE